MAIRSVHRDIGTLEVMPGGDITDALEAGLHGHEFWDDGQPAGLLIRHRAGDGHHDGDGQGFHGHPAGLLVDQVLAGTAELFELER